MPYVQTWLAVLLPGRIMKVWAQNLVYWAAPPSGRTAAEAQADLETPDENAGMCTLPELCNV